MLPSWTVYNHTASSGSCGSSVSRLRCGFEDSSGRLPCLSERWWGGGSSGGGSGGGGMRYHKAGLLALAAQPSHQFNKEGLLVLKERHDSFFRRSEVSCERWCRLRGNLLFYYKSRDHWGEAAGVLVLEHCSVGVEDTAPHAFTVEFNCGMQQVCEANSEADRDSWVAAIKQSSLRYLREKAETLSQQLTSLRPAPPKTDGGGTSQQNSGQPQHTPAVQSPPAAAPPLELSISCDNLLCDTTGLPPTSCVQVQLMPQFSSVWKTCHTTEIIQGSSNPNFVSTVIVGGVSNSSSHVITKVDDTCRLRLVVRRILEPLTSTSVIMGLAVTSVGSVRNTVKQRLSIISLAGDAVGFVTLASWAGEEGDSSSGQTVGGSEQPSYTHGIVHSTPTHNNTTQQQCVSASYVPPQPQHRRTQSLPPRLTSCRGKLAVPPQLSPIHCNPSTATYRFHSGLGGDIAVVEVMAESALTYNIPQQLLAIWMGAEKAWQEEVEALGLLSEPWLSRQRALVAMHSSRTQVYGDATTALAALASKNVTLKRSVEKENPLLEFAPINLHLQRMWAQNESLRRTGCYDVHTHGAFVANAQGFSQGGLLSLIQEQSRRCRDELSGRAECSRAAVESTRRLRASLASDLNWLLTAIRSNKLEGAPQTLLRIKDKIDLLLGALEADVVEAAFDFFDQIKVPQSPSHSITLASRNYSVHSNLAGYLSPESCLEKTLGQHVVNGGNNPSNAGLDVRLSATFEDKCKQTYAANGVDAKYYCSTDEPEPWDLIKLNLQASFICLSAKVSSLCSSEHEQQQLVLAGSGASSKLAPLAQMDVLSDTSATSSTDLLHTATSSTDLLHTATNTSTGFTPDDMSPTEDDSGISMMTMERNTPEAERKHRGGGGGAELINSSRSPGRTTDTTTTPAASASSVTAEGQDGGCDGGQPASNGRPKLASIMETSREDTIEGEDGSSLVVDTSTVMNAAAADAGTAAQEPSNAGTALDRPGGGSAVTVSEFDGVVPSVIKLRGAVDGAVRTARLVHSLHRLQLTTEAVHQSHALQYRRDVCFSQALTAATTALMAKLWSRGGTDHSFMTVLQHLGPLLQFEGLLSCIGAGGQRMADMVVAIEDLATVEFVLVPSTGDKKEPVSTPEPAVSGNRCNVRVLLPVPQAVVCLLSRQSTDEPLSFHVTPVYFNIGVNEDATLAAKLGQDGPQHRNNLDSFHRLAEYHHRYSKLELPVENTTKRVWSQINYDLTELMEKLKVAVQSNKSKNVEVLALAASVSRAMGGLRFTACKSGKDRTGMSVTLEQTAILASEFDLAQTEVQRCLNAMRSEGTRIHNCFKNIGLKKFAFNVIQLSMFPKEYVPPHGTYGATKT